ncbi:Protein transport protein S9 plasma membrane t-SNARE [Cladophialophora chaetospira]|uniref:Protein transport protein S9 plasma membrane t-SNARE n=1 Tax=Cladophialophora chaetospira TaxID=386627 RepID=A0AA38XMI4_9EURO|nr:Protein transport protein S9 plasma membrane t-SNARE [Cladophialophora chaetospira]
MGKFSLKRGDDDDGDSSRLALFGSRSKNKSPAPPSHNPYASQNPYAQQAAPPDPYTRAKMSAGVLPPPSTAGPPGQGGFNGLPGPGQQRPSYGRDNPYGGGPTNSFGGDNKYGPSQGGGGSGYGSDKFGNQNGYGGGGPPGGNPYASVQQTSGTSRQGGYGGLGSSNLYDNDSNRDELFGGARERLQQKPQTQPGAPPDYESSTTNNYGAADTSFGAYGDRQLTAEEEEEEDINATKQDIKFMKQQDVASTRNALRIAAQAEESGRNTLARLGAQGERMHNTDRNLDLGNNHINIAEDKTKELKTLNRSMFAVHVNNPFTASDRRAKRDEQIMDRHHAEREIREATRESAFKSTQRMNQHFKGVEDGSAGPKTKTSLAERAKYQFEDDSEDEGMENEIDRNLDDLSGAAKRLNLLARATGEEVEAQNKLIQTIAEKSDRFDDRLHFQTEKLKRIR